MQDLKHIALMGAICGDIIGSTHEFFPIKTTEFPLFPEGSRFTDDTVMTCAVADWLMNPDSVLDEKLQSWGRRYRVGYGPMFLRWIHSPNPQPYNSFGNGSAMRVAPVGWVASSIEECLELARKSAMVTHNHPEGVKGAQATAVAIFMARNGVSKADIKAYISDRFGYDLNRSVSEIRESYGFDVSCQGSVPESIICFLESTDYESAVRLAVSLGGDADTQGAITGSIAAAYYKEIPDMIFNKAWNLLTTEIQNTVSSFGTYLLRT